jgi:hypothetical protein
VTAPVRFRQDDIKRVMAGAKAAGFTRVRVGIDPDGNIVVEASNDPGEAPDRVNPLDRLLPSR